MEKSQLRVCVCSFLLVFFSVIGSLLDIELTIKMNIREVPLGLAQLIVAAIYLAPMAVYVLLAVWTRGKRLSVALWLLAAAQFINLTVRWSQMWQIAHNFYYEMYVLFPGLSLGNGFVLYAAQWLGFLLPIGGRLVFMTAFFRHPGRAVRIGAVLSVLSVSLGLVYTAFSRTLIPILMEIMPFSVYNVTLIVWDYFLFALSLVFWVALPIYLIQQRERKVYNG